MLVIDDGVLTVTCFCKSNSYTISTEGGILMLRKKGHTYGSREINLARSKDIWSELVKQHKTNGKIQNISLYLEFDMFPKSSNIKLDFSWH